MSVESQGRWERVRFRALAHLVACLAAGILAGVVWTAMSPRAAYQIDEDLHASLSERAYAEVVGGDATFVITTGVMGVVLGCLTWLWFHTRGRLVVGLTVLGAGIMTFAAWRIGQLIGGSGLTERLAMAGPGDLVQMDLELHALGALAVGPFAAITPIMLLAAFLPERSVDAAESEESAR